MTDIQDPLPWGKSSATVAILEQLVAEGPLDSSVPRRTLRRERAEPAEAVRARRWPDTPCPPDPEELLYLKQDEDEQCWVESRVVLPLKLQRRAPGVYQQSSSGATAEVGLGGVAPSATRQARSPHRRAGAPGEERVDGGGRDHKLPPVEGDPSHGKGPADLPAHPREPG